MKDLQWYINHAPSNFTHISVNRATGFPEFYNELLDSGELTSITVGMREGEAYPIGEHLSDILLRGTHDIWYLVPILPPSLENK